MCAWTDSKALPLHHGKISVISVILAGLITAYLLGFSYTPDSRVYNDTVMKKINP